VEAGQTYGDGSGVGPDHVFADAGFGLRLRLTGFVRTELNVGLAFPLVEGGDGASMRFYVTGHR
jgi:hypothetical protein